MCGPSKGCLSVRRIRTRKYLEMFEAGETEVTGNELRVTGGG